MASIREALEKCGAHDGMTLGFHHHFREGDLVVNMVMKEVHDMGIKDVTICASSLGKAHDPLISILKMERSPELNLPSTWKNRRCYFSWEIERTCDHALPWRTCTCNPEWRNYDRYFFLSGHLPAMIMETVKELAEKSDCGVLSYSFVDGQHANKVVAVTDCLVPFPNFPADIAMTRVDYVCVVDAIGIRKKLQQGAAKPTTDTRKLMMADYCTQVVVNTPYFKDGFSYQTGVGGASIASGASLAKIMEERDIKMGFAVGGMSKGMVDMLDAGLVGKLLDTQDFDLFAVNSVKRPNHHRISAGAYANPFNKGCFVNKLDYVVLCTGSGYAFQL